jgi:hypothetical protein
VRLRRNALLMVALLGVTAAGCNALWGIDALGYSAPSGGTTTSSGGDGDLWRSRRSCE